MGQKPHSGIVVRIQAIGSSRSSKNGLDSVYIPALETYSIKVCNNANSRCDIDIVAGSMELGSWRLETRETIVIEQYLNTSVGLRMFSDKESVVVIYKPERAGKGASPRDNHNQVCRRSNGRMYLVPALDTKTVDWDKAEEVTVGLVMT